MTTPIDTNRLRELHEKATPPRWYMAVWGEDERVCGDRCYEGIAVGGTVDNLLRFNGATWLARREVKKGTAEQQQAHADMNLISAMRDALPALLDAAEERDRLREALESVKVHALKYHETSCGKMDMAEVHAWGETIHRIARAALEGK